MPFCQDSSFVIRREIPFDVTLHVDSDNGERPRCEFARGFRACSPGNIWNSTVRGLKHELPIFLLRRTGDAAKLIWSSESRLRVDGCRDFSHVTDDGQLQRRPEMVWFKPQYMLAVSDRPYKSLKLPFDCG